MKKLFSLLILCGSVFSYAQKGSKIQVPYDSSTQKYTYVRIIEAPEKNAVDLFASAKKWCAEKYLDNKFISEVAGEELMDLGNFPIHLTMRVMGKKYPMSYTVLYSIHLLFKEGKSRVVISSFKISQNSQGSTEETTLENYKKFRVWSHERKKTGYVRRHMRGN
jgi:predicted molibdopterin-dependent oxidoreductase YjgC